MSSAKDIVANIVAERDASQQKYTEKWFIDITDKLRSKVKKNDPFPAVRIDSILPREKIEYLTKAGLKVEVVNKPANPNCPCASMEPCTCGKEERTIIRLP